MRQSTFTDVAPANDNAAPPSGQGELFPVHDINVGQVAVGDRPPHLAGHSDGMTVVHEILARVGAGIPLHHQP